MGQAAFVTTGSLHQEPRPLSRAEPVDDMAVFFDVSLDLLIIRDLDGVVIKASRSWGSSMGHGPQDMEGRSLLRLVHPDDLPRTRESVAEVEQRRTGGPVMGFINRYRHADGHYRLLEWRAQRFGDRIYGVARDVTKRVAAERELIEAQSAAEAASRAKSDFLANMSHEVRTPLNGVIGVVDALARTSLNPEQREMLDLIRQSGVVLERLVSDILDVSKIEAGQLRVETAPFDLGQTLDACVDLMRGPAETKGLTFRVVREADVSGRFLGDSTRLRQVLVNLLSNAVKFTAAGAVTLRIGLDETAGAARLTLAVEDTGVGFGADHAARLFERFRQEDDSIGRRFGGTGLGLSICRSLVELMGGEIAATSEPGVGSRFVVSLPARRAPAPSGAMDGPTSGAPNSLGDVPAAGDVGGQTRALRVLLAEDHPINQRVVQMILAGQGAELITVDDGAQAVAAFAGGAFDLVLMDMQMPVMDGLSATRAIRTLEADRGLAPTPIVMLSANAMAEHREQARVAGADLHLPKPITAATLLAGIETALEGVSRR